MYKKIIFCLFLYLSFFGSSFAIDDTLTSKITSDWGNGFCYDIVLKNTTNNQLNDWSLYFNLGNSSKITSIWGGTYIQDNGKYTVKSLSWNSKLEQNTTANIGFCATGSDYPSQLNYSFESNLNNNDSTSDDNDSTSDNNDSSTNSNVILKNFSVKKDNLEVFFESTSNRDGGYCRKIILKNIGTKGITNWKIGFELNQNLQLWGAEFIRKDNNYEIIPKSGNQIIYSGKNIELGFCSTGKNYDLNPSIIEISYTPIYTEPTDSTDSNTDSTNDSSIIQSETKVYIPESSLLIGYYPYRDIWRTPYNELEYDKLDIINFAFIFPNSDGSLRVPQEIYYKKLIDETHKYGKKIVISIGGGYESDDFSSVVLDEIKYKKFVNEIVKFVNDNNFDGVDIDWEFPRNEKEAQKYYDLLTNLKQKMPDKIVSTAVSIFPKVIDMEKISKIADYIYIMAYEIEGGRSGISGHNAPLYKNSNMQYDVSISNFMDTYYLNKNIDRSKFILGFPFYGKKFLTKSPYTPSSIATEILYRDIPNDCTEKWDDITKAVYRVCSDYYISYDNEKSFQEKINYTVDKKLGGMFIWALGQDDGKILSNIVKNNNNNTIMKISNAEASKNVEKPVVITNNIKNNNAVKVGQFEIKIKNLLNVLEIKYTDKKIKDFLNGIYDILDSITVENIDKQDLITSYKEILLKYINLY